MAILNRFSAILLCCDSTHNFASRCGISGDSRPASLGIVRLAIRDSVPLSPKWCDVPPLVLVSHRHICAIPYFAMYRASIKTSTREFCDSIATSIARYDKYRCWRLAL